MSSSTETPTVELSNLTKRFRDVTAVDDVDLSVRDGELLTLLGPSGCGKTTTLRMIAGFETPSAGDVSLDGDDVTGTPSYSRDTGMVFQHFALFPHMTVADNIAFGLEMEGLPDDEIEDRTREALEMVRLPDLGDRYPSELSGGQQQRVALARALVIEPEVLLLDEPLSDLDKKLREDMRLEILRLHRELDVTMIYVTHNQEEALTISDRMAVMAAGEIQQVGTPAEVYQEPNNEFVADFLGNANLLAGAVVDESDDEVTVEIDEGYAVTLNPSVANTARAAGGSDVTLLLRPERFKVHPEGATPGSANTFTGTVEEVTYLGSRVDYFVDIGGGDIHVVQQNIQRQETYQQGEQVTLAFSRDAPFVIPGDGDE